MKSESAGEWNAERNEGSDHGEGRQLLLPLGTFQSQEPKGLLLCFSWQEVRFGHLQARVQVDTNQ